MLNVKVVKKNNIIESITFNGHALYDIKGKDIVCASASSMMYTTVNAILSFDDKAIKYSESKEVKILNIKKDDITNKLLDNLNDMLFELSKQYPDNIKITEEGGN